MQKVRIALMALILPILIGFPVLVAQASVSSSSIVSLINTERSNAGLSGLSIDTALTRAAEEKAADMISQGYFDHIGPNGKGPAHWLALAGYKYLKAGENLAVNTQTVSERAIVDAWMDSPSHRANIMTGEYSETGVAVARGIYNGEEAVFVVQFFGTPAAAPKPAPEPVATTPAPAQTVTKTPVAPTTPTTQAKVSASPKTIEAKTTAPRIVSIVQAETEASVETEASSIAEAPKADVNKTPLARFREYIIRAWVTSIRPSLNSFSSSVSSFFLLSAL